LIGADETQANGSMQTKFFNKRREDLENKLYEKYLNGLGKTDIKMPNSTKQLSYFQI
jgi:hypothetical protein